MHPIIAEKLRATLPLPENDVPCVRVLVPGLDTGVFELTPAQYQAMVCAILNTPDDAEPVTVTEVRADGEVMLIPAHSIFSAFTMARVLRPDAIVVSDNTEE